jgi:hypothetical protein
MRNTLACVLLYWVGAALAQSPAAQPIDLTERLTAGKLRPVNRTIARLSGGPAGIHVSANEGPGVVWIEGSNFAEGTIEVDVRGRDVFQQSFLGVAFHRKDDDTYESVYLRPFNFRADDPARHHHAVQYMAVPDFDWPVLREKFPEEFENAVDKSAEPAGWVSLRVVVKGDRVQAFAGIAKTPVLDVRKLGKQDRGMIGLWVGNNSDGDFANFRLTPAN